LVNCIAAGVFTQHITCYYWIRHCAPITWRFSRKPFCKTRLCVSARPSSPPESERTGQTH